MPEQPDENEVILASAVRFLLDGHEDEAANILLSCSLSFEEVEYEDFGVNRVHTYAVLTGPRFAYDMLYVAAGKISENPFRNAIERALKAIQPQIYDLKSYAERIAIDSDWRSAMLESAQGKSVTNQLADVEKFHTWNNLRFRSVSEMRVAHALDKAGVLFFPNCRCRLTTPEDTRKNVEPDFLVLYQGKWGILEVDGEPFHPPSRTVQDHERDRLFNRYRILVVQHFDAEECFENADGVVQKFLDILKRS